MATGDLLEKVSSWVEKTGLPLELEAKAAFKQAKFQVTHSALYVDPESEKGREIDVIAYHRDPIGLIQKYFVVECKSGGNPWVVLTDSATYPYPINYSLGLVSPRVIPSLDSGWNQPRHRLGECVSDFHRAGYAVKQAFSGQDDAAYSTAISVLKASHAVVSEQTSQTQRLKLVFPVIVVDAPIFECRLDDEGKLKFRQVEYSEAKFTAYIPERTVSSLKIVTRKELPHFARYCAKLCERVDEALANKVGEYVESLKSRGQRSD